MDLYQYMDEDMKEYFKDEVYEGINQIDGKLYYIPTCGTTGRLIIAFFHKCVNSISDSRMFKKRG